MSAVHSPSAHKPSAWRYQRGCRHPACTAAATASWAASSARARERAAADPSLVTHGTVTGRRYWGCGCTRCAEAARLSDAAHRARTKRRNGKPLTDYDRVVLELAS